MQQKKHLKEFLIKSTSLYFIIGLSLIDILTKSYMQNLLSGRKRINLIPKILNLFYVENKGAAFSILSGHSWIFIIISILFIVVSLYFIFIKNITGIYLKVLILILSGCIGNFYDRIVFSHVRDFLELDFIKFPIFNIADIYITLAAFILIISMITGKEK